MARHAITRWLFVVAVIAMPLSYGVKKIFDLIQITWIDPTLVLAVPLFVFLGWPIRKSIDVGFVLYAFASALVGWGLLAPSFDRPHSAAYTVFMEPFRLLLNMLWFWCVCKVLLVDRRLVITALATAVLLESVAATLIYLVTVGWIQLQGAPGIYFELYKLRQSVYFGDLRIVRAAGTFDEAPPFGLFMFSCFVALYLACRSEKKPSRYWRAGMILSFVGAIASLSDQVIVAIVAFVVGILLSTKIRGPKRLEIRVAAIVLLIAGTYGSYTIAKKWLRSTDTVRGGIIGESASERMFHLQYGAGLLVENPLAIATGIGPGRYGDYVVRTGIFPSSTGMSTAVVEWFVELGLIGIFIISLWFSSFVSDGIREHGVIAPCILFSLVIANMFQGNWKWESWFFALAVLGVVTDRPTEATRDQVSRSLAKPQLDTPVRG